MSLRVNIVKIVFQLLTPAVHLGDYKTGSEQLFRRLKFVLSNGRIEEVPYISGNEIRGQLRRLIFKDFLKLVGYEPRERVFRSFFEGGVLEEIEEKSTPQLDIELRRKIRSLITPASLLGFAWRNQVIEGKLKVMHALPLCRELVDYLPDDIVNTHSYKQFLEKSFYDYLDRTFHTRHAEERRSSPEEPTVQMIYGFEVLIPGTVMYTELICDDCNEIELSCLARMIKLWNQHPFIGGKSASGYGKIKFLETKPDFTLDDSLYLTFIREKKNEILKILQELDR